MKTWFWLVLGAMLMSVSMLTGTPMGNDEGVWAYIGRIWVERGVLPYTGAIENKATGIYTLYAFAHRFFGFGTFAPRLFAIVAMLATGYALYILTKKISKNDTAAIIAMALFLLIQPLKSVDGAYAETECFMNLFRVLAFLLTVIAYEKKGGRWMWLLGAGVMSAFAISFKQLAVFDAIPLLFFHWHLLRETTKISSGSEHSPANLMSSFAINLFLVFFGALFGTALSLVPYLLSGGTFRNYIDGAWVILLQSGEMRSMVARISGFFWHFFNIYLSPLLFGVLGFIGFRKTFRKEWWFAPLLAWAIADFLAYNADGWYLDHHFKVLIPSWAIITGIVVSFVIDQLTTLPPNHLTTETPNHPTTKTSGQVVRWSGGQVTRSGGQVVKVFLLGLLIFYIPSEGNYYQNIRKFLKGNMYDTSATDMGRYLRARTRPGDRVYVWGFHIGPEYYFSDRLAPGRYFSQPFLGAYGALAETERDFSAHPPFYIVIPTPLDPPDAWLMNIVKAQYRFVEAKYGFNIYQKNS